MRKINVLLGNTDRRLNNLIEAMVLDVCYDQATVEFTRVARASEIVRLGRYENFDLILVAPDHLLPGRPGRDARPLVEEVRDAILAIDSTSKTPVVAFGVAEEDTMTLLQAGAVNVFESIYDAEILRPEVQRVLDMVEVAESPEPETNRWSLGNVFSRGLELLKS